jgi:hypothetical protein
MWLQEQTPKDICFEEIELHAQNMATILSLTIRYFIILYFHIFGVGVIRDPFDEHTIIHFDNEQDIQTSIKKWLQPSIGFANHFVLVECFVS